MNKNYLPLEPESMLKLFNKKLINLYRNSQIVLNLMWPIFNDK